MPVKGRYLFAQIDISAIVNNCGIFRKLIPRKCRLCVAVKCNAYGHGIDVVLAALKAADVEMLCVAAISEAQQLRELGWKRPILLLGSEFSIYHGREKAELACWIVQNDVRITVMDETDMDELHKAAVSVKKPAIIHVKLDTGMNRMGLTESRFLELIHNIRARENVFIEGLYTHLATADEPDKTYADYQIQKLRAFVDRLQATDLHIPIIHTANSAAAVGVPGSHFDMIRPGISVYGYHCSPQMRNKPDFKPAMKVISYLTVIKHIPAGSYVGYGRTYQASSDMLIGLVSIGYGDGYDRRLSNVGKMTIHGHFVPVIGRVSMDYTTVDLSELVHKGLKVSVGEEVTVIDNDRNAPNSVEAIATQLQTIPYEIVTKLGPRILRVPLWDGK